MDCEDTSPAGPRGISPFGAPGW